MGIYQFWIYSAHEQINVHIKTGYQWSSRKPAARMQEIVMLMKLQERGERSTMCTKLGSNSQSVLHRRFSECTGEGGGLVESTWTVCLAEIVRYVFNVGREEQSMEIVKTLVSMFS